MRCRRCETSRANTLKAFVGGRAVSEIPESVQIEVVLWVPSHICVFVNGYIVVGTFQGKIEPDATAKYVTPEHDVAAEVTTTIIEMLLA